MRREKTSQALRWLRARVAQFAGRGPEARPTEADGFVSWAEVDEQAEELAQARLEALKQERGLVV